MKIKYNSITYRKDSAMWKAVSTTTAEIGEKVFYDFIKAFGYTSTDYGTWWKRTAHDEAHEFVILDVII